MKMSELDMDRQRVEQFIVSEPRQSYRPSLISYGLAISIAVWVVVGFAAHFLYAALS